MKSRPFSKLVDVIVFSDMRGVRLLLAWGSIFWGVLLLWPGETFSRPTYALMAKFAPEVVWGLAFLFQGAVMMYSLITQRHGKPIFIMDCMLGCALWVIATVACFASVSPPPAAMSAELVATFASFWNLVRFASDCSFCAAPKQ